MISRLPENGAEYKVAPPAITGENASGGKKSALCLFIDTGYTQIRACCPSHTQAQHAQICGTQHTRAKLGSRPHRRQ